MIDTELQDAHTISTVDLNDDGVDEIIVGARGTHNVCLYAFDGKTWGKSVLDDNMPAAGCAITDLNGDGAPDIACIGDGVLKWYENMGQWEGKPPGR
ncbi:MAG: VCBS repeat-containing protein [Bryobacteraceae bacterium]